YEMKDSQGHVAEQIIRPTGIVDPPIEVRPTKGQIDDFVAEVRKRAEKNERVLATTLTKRMSEDLSRYLEEKGLKVKYLHSDIQTIERSKILHDLRIKKFDCLIGVNLLREGLDLPEVSLVAIFDANKEGFLRSRTSLIQTSGRAARHVEGRVIMYADSISAAMRATISECERRRAIQLEYNRKHNIMPQPIVKSILHGIEQYAEAQAQNIILDVVGQAEEEYSITSFIADLEREMEQTARNLEFEKAAAIRDKIADLKKL
ncbi:MAG: excinuclease ABC subunit B, partial [Candidatus Omnitrophica bacterium CG12_big_fil_rev_8_21_14_0_65_50_5]